MPVLLSMVSPEPGTMHSTCWTVKYFSNALDGRKVSPDAPETVLAL